MDRTTIVGAVGLCLVVTVLVWMATRQRDPIPCPHGKPSRKECDECRDEDTWSWSIR